MPEVTELHPVPDAHVPVMKFKFNGVSLDLLYAKLSLWVIPEVRTGLPEHLEQCIGFCEFSFHSIMLLYPHICP